MPSYELTGRVKTIMETQTFNSGFCKREFVVTTDDEYPQDIKLAFVKDKVERLDRVSVGDAVKVGFNLRGNEYNGRYFVDLTAWKIDIDGGGSAVPPPEAPENRDVHTTTPPEDQDGGNLPF